MLKIRSATLAEHGLDLNEKLSVEQLNARMEQAPDSAANKVQFADPISVRLHVEKVPYGMTVKGEVGALCTQTCGRCAESVSRPYSCPVDHVFKHHTNPNIPMPEEDIGVSFFTEDPVELGDMVEETLVLGISPYWHPDDDPQGICTHCKRNVKDERKPLRKDSQSLGDALRKAGVK